MDPSSSDATIEREVKLLTRDCKEREEVELSNFSTQRSFDRGSGNSLKVVLLGKAYRTPQAIKLLIEGLDTPSLECLA